MIATTWNVHRDRRVLEYDLYDKPFWRPLVIETAEAASKVTTDEFERDIHIQRGLDVIETAAQAVNEDWWDRETGKAPSGWYHRSSPRLAGKKFGDPYIMRLQVEEAAAAYLRLPFRVDSLDRLLSDMLIGQAKALSFS